MQSFFKSSQAEEKITCSTQFNRGMSTRLRSLMRNRKRKQFFNVALNRKTGETDHNLRK